MEIHGLLSRWLNWRVLTRTCQLFPSPATSKPISTPQDLSQSHRVTASASARSSALLLLFFSLVFFCFPFWHRVFPHSPGCPQTQYVDQAGLELREICLPLPFEKWDERHVPPCPVVLCLFHSGSCPCRHCD